MADERRTRPAVVAFDVVGTLFPLDPLVPRLREAGLPDRALDEWFARFLRDAVALDTVGTYVPFRDVAGATLEVMLAEHGQDSARAAAVLEGFAELSPYPDARGAFELLRSAGVRTMALTNGSAATTQRLLDRAGLGDFVERIVSIDEVRHWKPHREVYLHAARVAGVVPSACALVAAHAWDVLGAARAGLTTGWVYRKEKRFHPAMGRPTVQNETLADVVAGLLMLPG